MLAAAQARPGNDRVECQTLFSTARRADGASPAPASRAARRHYLVRPLSSPVRPLRSTACKLRPVRREDLPAAAEIIHRSHQGSLDAALNLTYATPALCRSFVETLVLRAGCGRFDPEASFVAEGRDGPGGSAAGQPALATNGHICQVSVLPDRQGAACGRALLDAGPAAFRRQGLSAPACP